MWFLDNIIYWLAYARDRFEDAWEEVEGWIFPFWYLYYPLYYIWWAFKELTKLFVKFNDWVDDTAKKLTTFFTELDLWAWFKPWVDKILDAWNWFVDRWSWFWQSAGEWWNTIIPTVKGWIDIATEGFDQLKVAWDTFRTITWPGWTGTLEKLKDDIAFFFKWQLPELFNLQRAEEWWKDKFIEVTDYVFTELKLHEPLWAGWQDFRDKVVEFFTDPLGWLEARFTDWFLGAE